MDEVMLHVTQLFQTQYMSFILDILFTINTQNITIISASHMLSYVYNSELNFFLNVIFCQTQASEYTVAYCIYINLLRSSRMPKIVI